MQSVKDLLSVANPVTRKPSCHSSSFFFSFFSSSFFLVILCFFGPLFFVSESIISYVEQTGILSAYRSDHSKRILKLSLGNEQI